MGNKAAAGKAVGMAVQGRVACKVAGTAVVGKVADSNQPDCEDRGPPVVCMPGWVVVPLHNPGELEMAGRVGVVAGVVVLLSGVVAWAVLPQVAGVVASKWGQGMYQPDMHKRGVDP